MSVVPLTGAQQAAVDSLVAAGRLAAVPVDEGRSRSFLDQAAELLEAVSTVRAASVRFVLGYDAAHAVGEAVLAAYGYRTSGHTGQHVAVGAFIEVVFDRPPPSTAARTYDRLRTGRNNLHYQARPAGEASATSAAEAATVLLAAARELIA